MFLRNVLLTYFTEIFCAAVNFATGILLARVLSPADRGVMVLVMTGNSRFKQEQIDAFARRVEARGGRLTRHIFLRRGRILWQLSREELLEAIRAELK